jgi:hypothetical protein
MRLRHVCLLAAAGFSILIAAAPARAALLIEVDKSTQQMTVVRDGETLYTWPVSTGISSYDTPAGEFKPFRMEKDHFSREWDDAPMPYSIFFTMQGHAIHGSNHKSIGRPASHGCVRLEPKNARVLFDLVKQEKMANTRVVLTGEIPQTTEAPPSRAARRRGRISITTAAIRPTSPTTITRRRRAASAWYAAGANTMTDRATIIIANVPLSNAASIAARRRSPSAGDTEPNARCSLEKAIVTAEVQR